MRWNGSAGTAIEPPCECFISISLTARSSRTRGVSLRRSCRGHRNRKRAYLRAGPQRAATDRRGLRNCGEVRRRGRSLSGGDRCCEQAAAVTL